MSRRKKRSVERGVVGNSPSNICTNPNPNPNRNPNSNPNPNPRECYRIKIAKKEKDLVKSRQVLVILARWKREYRKKRKLRQWLLSRNSLKFLSLLKMQLIFSHLRHGCSSKTRFKKQVNQWMGTWLS